MYEYEIKKVSDLLPYVNNSRTHSEEQTTQIASSISEFGFTNPVLIDDTNNLIAGHGRLLAAKKLGLEEVPAIILSGLTKAQKKAYVIADNQLALNAEWDLDTLKLEIEGLKELNFDVDLLGFDDSFLDVIAFDEDFDAGTEGDQGQLDKLDPKYVDCPHCKKTFDLRDIE
jgi:ParB-like chromosome segregation protein Spo0J